MSDTRTSDRAPETGIQIKGRPTATVYQFNLAEIFRATGPRAIREHELMQVLHTYGLFISVRDLHVRLFGYRSQAARRDSPTRPTRKALPFTMSCVLDSHFEFNLQYQDAVIKSRIEIASEYASDLDSEVARNALLERVLFVTSAVLWWDIDLSGVPCFLGFSHMELDHVVRECVAIFPEVREAFSQEALFQRGAIANARALAVQSSLSTRSASIHELITQAVYAGVVWWAEPPRVVTSENEREITRSHAKRLIQLTQQPLAIDDTAHFEREILNVGRTKRLLFLFDDSGELVCDLMFLNKALEINRGLTITCCAHMRVVSNTACAEMVEQLLDSMRRELPHLLNPARFKLISEPNDLAAIDLRFASDRLLQELDIADVVVAKGAAHYETIQYLSRPTYYMFTVHGRTSQMLTGLCRGAGVFARVCPGITAYSIRHSGERAVNVIWTLKTIHDVVSSIEFLRLVDLAGSETEAARLLISQLNENGKDPRKACRDAIAHLELSTSR